MGCRNNGLSEQWYAPGLSNRFDADTLFFNYRALAEEIRFFPIPQLIKFSKVIILIYTYVDVTCIIGPFTAALKI